MRARALFATLSIALSSAACSEETAIVLVIEAGDDAAKASIVAEVHVGAGDLPAIDAGDEARWFGRAQLVMEPAVLTFDGGLGDGRYELLVRPSAALAPDAELMVAVTGTDGQQVIAFGPAADFVRFAEGEVRRVPIVLRAYDPFLETAGITSTGCVWWNDPRREVPAKKARDRAIVPSDDLDCDDFRPSSAQVSCDGEFDCDDQQAVRNPARDQGCDAAFDDDCCDRTTPDTFDGDDDGVPACDDCDDGDPWGRPGEAETCDGVDTACDGVMDTSSSHRCVPTTATLGECRAGSITCTETRSRPTFGPCIGDPNGPLMPARVCSPCPDGDDPLLCDDGRFRSCTIHSRPGDATSPCTPPLQQVPLPPCPVAACTWTLENGTDANGWRVTLIDPANTQPTVPVATHTGPSAAVRVVRLGPARQPFVVRRTGGFSDTLEAVWLEGEDAAKLCSPVQCTGGSN